MARVNSTLVVRTSVSVRIRSATCTVVVIFSLVVQFINSKVPLAHRSSYALAVLAPWLVVAYTVSVRPKLELSHESVRVVGPISQRRYEINQIDSAEGGIRLILHMRDGRDVKVWASQNSRLTEMRGAWGPSDEAAKLINEFLDATRAQHP